MSRQESLSLVHNDHKNKISRCNSSSSILEDLDPESHKGTASLVNVSCNIAKTAAGTGILALPYACKQGGVLVFLIGMILIPAWNVYCMKLLCEAYDYLVRLGEYPYDDDDEEEEHNDVQLSPKDSKRQNVSFFGDSKHDMIVSRKLMRERPPPPMGTSSMSKLGWYALGRTGLMLIDSMMLMLLLFINIAFEVAILTFAERTPFTTGTRILDAIILGFLLVPLSIAEDLSQLSKLSRWGLITLGFTMFVVAFYGFIGHEDNAVSSESSKVNPINLFPHNGIEGISKWFGCVVFSFGIVPLTFNFRESMEEPEKLSKAATISMSLVAISYALIGVGFLYLFPNIEKDLLSELPSDGILTTTTRLAMIVVTIASTPLLIVPCAEIIEGKIIENKDGREEKSKKLMIITRTCLALGTVIIASELPNFVSVLAFVGSFAVSTVSFFLPPGLHWLLLRQGIRGEEETLSFWSRVFDLMMLLVGFVTTVITTWYACASK